MNGKVDALEFDRELIVRQIVCFFKPRSSVRSVPVNDGACGVRRT